MLPTKPHGNRWELTSELTSKRITFNNTQSNFTPISLITFAVINQTSSNLQGSCRNNSQCCLQNYMGNGWELTSESTSKWITFNNTQSNFTPSSLITFAVIIQTSPDLQGSCRNTSRWCLQNYIENSWELTSELTSKWITFNNTQSNLTPISLIIFCSNKSNFAKFTLIKLRQIYREDAVITADGACKTTSKTVENWNLNWRLNE